MSLRVQAAHGVKWQAIEIVGRQLLSFVVFTTLARLLHPSAFGLLGLVGVYLAFIGMFVDQGISTALIQREDLTDAHLNAAFWFNLICASALCAMTVIAAPWIAIFFKEATLAPLLRWSSFALILNALSAVQGTLFIREMNFRQHAIRGLLSYLVGGGVGVVMALTGYGVWALVGQQLSSSLAGTLFMCVSSSYRPRFQFSPRHLRELMALSTSVFSTTLLFFFTSRLDQLVIGRFMGFDILGQYSFATKLPEMAKSVVHQPLASISMPTLSRLQNDHPRMANALYKGMDLNALVSFAVFFGLVAVAPTIVPVLFGDKWLPAIPYMQLWAIHSAVIGLFVYCTPALLATGGPGKYVLLSFLGSLGTVIVCLAGIKLGAFAILVGLILNIFLTGVISLFFLRRRMGVSPWLYLKPTCTPAIASIIMVLAVYLLRHALADTTPRWLSLAIQILFGATVYLSVILLIDRQRLASLRGFASIMYRRRNAEEQVSPT